MINIEQKQSVITGLEKIAEYFGCSTKTVSRNFQRRLYGKAMKKVGREYYFNPDEFWV
ncbi:MAG: DUF3853 family protein [Paludibacteraceae bacterium]|nr:DUF3853 family protein [Paludibacteraceae bacterium]